MQQRGIREFGGGWSGAKLEALQGYLKAYLQAMAPTPFKLAYIDAFAGAGLREVKTADEGWFAEMLDDDEDRKYRHGSPLIALSLDPAFDSYIFIEKDEASLKALEKQVRRYPDIAGKDIRFLHGDANGQLQVLTQKDWKGHRAVAFLDPFALDVDWNTIERIGKTRAIDMWLLFPAMAVNRMLTKSGEIPEAWRLRLDRLFGTDDWHAAFYSRDQMGLFGEEEISKTARVFQTLSAYVTERLKTVFAGVNKSPLVLRNRTGTPLFLLCFAAGNARGAPIAIRIAQHIINTSKHG